MYKAVRIITMVSFLFISFFEAQGQTMPRAVYNFDALDISESTGNFSDGSAKNNDFYDCGVGENSNALSMEGSADTICLDPKVKSLMEDNFSLSFYFWPQYEVESYTLFSIQNNCERDSSLNIRFTANNELRIELAANAGDAVNFFHTITTDICWHQIVLTRNGTTYSLYVDGAFVESIEFLTDISFGKNHPVYVGFSECVGRFDEYYDGRIDEIRIYDTAIDENEINAIDFNADRVLSQDTTLFEGDAYQIFTGSTCANNITWSPATGLDDASSLSPVATPSMTTTYEVTFDNGTCVSTDSVRISVVQSDDIDCNTLLLPKAFTPNGDNLNDEFGISNGFIISDLARYEIYDRWGLKLYEASNKADMWDGTYKGQSMSPGTYVYKIEYQCLDNNYKKTGSFNLIK